MLDRDKWHEIFQVILKNPFRSLVTCIGVFWGILMLTMLLAANSGLRNGVTADFGSQVTNSLAIWGMRTQMPYKGFNKGRWVRIRNGDVDHLRENLDEIDILSPRIQLGGYSSNNNVTRGVETGSFSIYGDYPEYIKIKPMDIVEGRFVNWADMEDAKKICVIGQKVYESLFLKDEQAIGEYIKINGINFKVVGLFKSKMSGDEGDEETQTIYVPFTTAQKAFNMGDEIGWLSMTAKEGISCAEVEEKAIVILKERIGIHPDDPRALGHWNMEKEFEEFNSLFSGISYLSWIIGILSLLAGIIGITNIMLIVVKERTNEIGIRRAMGATPGTVIRQILAESAILTFMAGVIGLLLGIWAVEALDSFVLGADATGSFRNPEIKFNALAISLVTLVFFGVLAGILPAYRAVSLKPIDAIRQE